MDTDAHGRAGAARKEFVSEPLIPVEASFAAASMYTGEPGLPTRFVWRGTEYEVTRVLDKWKTTGPCRHGSGERYVRRHWFRVEVAGGTEMEIYFDRQPQVKQVKQRWWLATIATKEGQGGRPGEEPNPF